MTKTSVTIATILLFDRNWGVRRGDPVAITVMTKKIVNYDSTNS